MKYHLTSKGDHYYNEWFDSIEGVYGFLYTLLDRLHRYYESKEAVDSDFCIDIEDDQIIVTREDGEKRYFNGWHWVSDQDKPDIIMPDGETFYQKVSRLQV